jgi:hypothetical protein
MSFQYYTFPQNTSGSANIPIFNTPTPLAILTAVPGSGSDIATVRANIGWQGISRVARVLFKIWRGAPGTGQLVCSVQDCAESPYDDYVTTDFSGVVSGLTANQPDTFVLTAETVDAGAQASVIGPLTMTIYDANSNILSYYQFPNNTFGAANIPVSQTPVPVGFITVNVQPGQNVILRHSCCWTASTLYAVDVLFKIWRGPPVTGTLIASATDSSDYEGGAVTSFSHVDRTFVIPETITYVITAEVLTPGRTLNIVGALTTTGSTQELGAFYTLPQNTSGSVTIPITNSATPLAAITVQASPSLILSLRAAIGWQLPPGPRVPILYKIWRGAPNTGSLIYSTLDSGEGDWDYRKVTALAHVDRGFDATGPVTYTLTAELINPGTTANVIGPVTFTAVPEN